ncbi:MAG TPA: metallophosphoesterase [Microthrixaceae bacterium]|nr:metallophosphoesterase [Microthrixaceae bacterium]
MLRPSARIGSVDLFAIEPDRVQLVWTGGCHGPIRVQVDGRSLDLDSATSPGGAGAVEITGLKAGTSYELEFSCRTDLGPQSHRRRFATPQAPLGLELFRFATISDLHLGRGLMEYRGPIAYLQDDGTTDDLATRENPAADLQLRLARSAVTEAIDWGAKHLVVKGDLCDQSYDWIWDQAEDLLRCLPIPVSIIPGNHDTGRLRKIEPEVAARARGLHVTRGVGTVDFPGMSLILADSTVPGTSWGSLDRSSQKVADLASDARRDHRGVVVMTHHHAQRLTLPVFWPQGIPAPNAGRFATALHSAAPEALVSSGHTHRCRRRDVDGVVWSEVAATSQFPGAWAGYVVHEHGIRQTVHRIADPTSLDLIESGRRMLNGVWALWSTGNLADRCFNLDWTR